MSESEQDDPRLKYPDWQKPFQEAVLELDPDEFEKRLVVIQLVIFNRLEAIRAEKQALEDALSTLRMLAREETKAAKAQGAVKIERVD